MSILTEAQETAQVYERINKLWADADIPTLVRDTPNRKDGWQVLLAWVERLQGWTTEIPFAPSFDAIWSYEVHVFSHCLNVVHGGVGGHSVRRAETEEEGARLVLDWWKGVRNAGRSG